MAKKTINPGDKFGILTAIKVISGNNTGYKWLAKCQCGNEKILYQSVLINSVSCGCSRRLDDRPKIGDVFGNWTVINGVPEIFNYGKNKGYRHYRYECECKCGRKKKLLLKHLKFTHGESCAFCRNRKLDKNGFWTGGRKTTKDGYILILDRSHPNAQKRHGYVFEHIKVMTEMIGRPLEKGENVHHMNGIKDDNRPENLELWTHGQPTGYRVSDMIAFCLNYLQQYAPDKINKSS